MESRRYAKAFKIAIKARRTDKCAFAPLLTSGNLPCLSCNAPVAIKNNIIINDVKITN